MTKKYKSIYYICILVFFIVITLSNTAFSTSLSNEKLYNVEANYEINGEKYNNKSVAVYQIAKTDDYGKKTNLSQFENYNLDFNIPLTSFDLKTIGERISGIIKSNQISPIATGKTDSNGKMIFKDLPKGIYMLEVENTIEKYKTIVYEPTVFSILSENQSGNTAIIKPKGEISEISKKLLKYKVVILWDDLDWQERPEEVEIKIFKNDDLYDTVILSNRDNWSYEWEEEDDGSVWTVMEEGVPQAYVVYPEESNRDFYITNVYRPTEKIPEANVPDTGEGIGIFVYIGLAVISALGFIVTTTIYRRIEKK